jgi:trimeric autotransporter adhesin
VQVTVNGFNCPMIYASASQVSAVVPYEAKAYATATVLVKYLGQGSNGVTMTVATTVPGVFTYDSSGKGPGAILNSNLSVNTALNPAARGDIVVIYMTGEGETAPGGVTGKVTTVASPPAPLTPAPLLPVSVTIGGQPAQWTFAGEAPGFVSGVLQLNVVVPTNIAAGNQPIVVTIGGNPSQQGVTVAVK